MEKKSKEKEGWGKRTADLCRTNAGGLIVCFFVLAILVYVYGQGVLEEKCAFTKEFAAQYLVNCKSTSIGNVGVTICLQVPPGLVNPKDIQFMDIPGGK